MTFLMCRLLRRVHHITFACHWLNHIAVTPTKIPSCTGVKQDKDDFIISHFLTVTNKVAAGIKACGSNVGTLGS